MPAYTRTKIKVKPVQIDPREQAINRICMLVGVCVTVFLWALGVQAALIFGALVSGVLRWNLKRGPL